jgi:hypothetical protein
MADKKFAPARRQIPHPESRYGRKESGTLPDQQSFSRSKVENMATKPPPGTRKAEKFKDGQKKSGGAKALRLAGPGRASKTRPRRGKRTEP